MDGGPASERAPLARAFVDGQVVAEALADRWAVLSESGGATATRAFELELPARFADGRARRVRIVDEAGGDLPGSPCDFIAFADGLDASSPNAPKSKWSGRAARSMTRCFPALTR